MNEDNLAKQEESVKKQEAMKRGTVTFCLCAMLPCSYCSQHAKLS